MRKLLMMVLAGMIAVAFTDNALAGKGKDRGKGDAEGKKSEFAAADADKDGKLSATEFATIAGEKHADKKFTKADANADGSITPEELKAAKEAHGAKGGGKRGKK